MLALLSACSIQGSDSTCPADITYTLQPKAVAVAVGETATPTFKVFTCAGTVEKVVEPVWASLDSKVATVNNSTGTITGRTPGNTRIRVTEQMSLADDFVSVTVTAQ